ncbi:MAG TPA: phosphoenolpyruvate--protein phosphotransferase [Leptospiraceae bacterium]|nr:phosphoenolpyruvate--protein phosphotransferase [Leptospiraceae bacterium]HMW04612.1 phosphoenolpyruvate--protein phosphotransferase [Leptospiraceae bacterium]HMX31667.1 phosphoenolpyruvate--protein phosphotransferase [Leptospiraceae bacterium]HMY30449.1 phosphoenolpyruvate--protein phosphotransferase [Leptospiraceae bacterium]HMZ67050.1 phosphoenolpyruvate--protein phosphotransferase [Leptospiraceae bacterium]
MPTNKTVIYKGIPASYGKFYGKALKIISSKHIILQTRINEKKVKFEISKFQKALTKTKKELEGIIEKKTVNQDIKDILVSQICMLDDPLLIDGVIRKISDLHQNAALALFNSIEEISNKFTTLNDDYFSERAVDIRDIGRRIEDNLLGRKSDYNILSDIKEEVIIVAHELTPSQMMHIDKKMVKGIATETGGKTGHMAILAKNYSIPTVVGINNITSVIEDNEFILIDADDGVVIRNPVLNQIKLYAASSSIEPEKYDNLSSVTHDGQRILVKVNLDTENDCDSILRLNADGVGLYRSEVILIEDPDKIYDEEEQFHIYKKIASDMHNFPVTIRTFDLGGDKFDTKYREDNPFLGNRGIRFALKNTSWFKKQLRAILRASVYGNISIMIPMVSSISEVIETKKLIVDAKMELRRKGIDYKDVNVGIMVETPACALALDQFAKECDFFSIGTNDLLQYTMAVDRNNHYISELYNPYNLSFLRLLKMIIGASNTHQIPLSICGELASDTKFTILLLGLGLRELSVSLPLVRKIKKIISSTDISQAQILAEKVLNLSENEKFVEIDAFLFNRHI